MSAQLKVLIEGNGPDAMRQRAVLATLANDYRVVDRGGDVVLISGRDGNAAAALAQIDASVRAVMLVSPASLDPDLRRELGRITAERDIPVVAGFDYAPWFAAEGLRYDPADDENVEILDLLAGIDDAGAERDAMLELLWIARLMIGEVNGIRTLLRTPNVTIVEAAGEASRLNFRMTVRRSIAPGLTVERIARGRRSKVAIAHDAHARPAEISHHDASGSHVQYPVYQGGYRAGWIGLASGERDAVPSTRILAQIEADLALIGR